jgi:hypothetical protein
LSGTTANANATPQRTGADSGLFGHPVYDCFYLALAEQANASFVTADSRLFERLAGTPPAALAASLASFDPSRASPRP